jgi:hypothetical protein
MFCFLIAFGNRGIMLTAMFRCRIDFFHADPNPEPTSQDDPGFNPGFIPLFTNAGGEPRVKPWVLRLEKWAQLFKLM